MAVTRARRRKSFGADSPEVVTIGGFVSLLPSPGTGLNAYFHGG